MSDVKSNSSVPASRTGGSGVGGVRGNTNIPRGIDDAIVYPTKIACIKALISGMDKYPASRNAPYAANISYTADFNSWLMASGYMYSADQTKNWAKNGIREAYFERVRTIRWNTSEGLVEVNASEGDVTSRLANNKSCYCIFQNVRKLIPRMQMFIPASESNQTGWTELDEKLEWIQWYFTEKRRGWKHKILPRVQMEVSEKTTEQGETTQESDKRINTIITRDQQQTVSAHEGALDSVDLVCSSEPPHIFNSITQRWTPLDVIILSTSDKQSRLVKTYYLPEGLYRDQCVPNLNPFETFIYGRMSIEVRIVVNGNRFCCGKVLLSSKYDSYQADAIQDGIQSALNRNHIIIDVSANNEGLLQIPFRYHRPWMRLVQNGAASPGVRPSKYASLYLHILSPITTGVGGPSEINARIFFRFKESKFTGMSYRVPVTQGFGVEDIVTPTTALALKEVLLGAERAFDQIGRSRNQDKPSNISAVSIIPKPKINFGGGKGITDVTPLRVNPHTLTNYKSIVTPQDEPQSFYELARIWGIYKTIKWSSTNTEGEELASIVIDPTARSYTSDVELEMTPLEYAASNFSFWTGSIEVRLDFVSNSFHTGTVQISAEFGRTTSSSNVCESSAGYTKIFHLGDQKSVLFRIPYIYDTVMRRTTAGVYNPYQASGTTDEIKSNALTIAPESQARFKIRVINCLRPPAAAPQSIEILMFIRAGRNFRFHGLKGVSTIVVAPHAMQNFPEGYKPRGGVPASRRTRDVTNSEPSKMNKWNEYKPDQLPQTQMDNGEKEDLDPTDDFNQGITALDIMTLDDHMQFKDLLRRPTLLMWNVSIFSNTTGAFYIPLQPPSRQMSVVGDFTLNNVWSPTLSQTSAMAIMDMFRVWRGSMRYTIVLTSGTKPVYVSLVPHSGVRVIGNHKAVTSARDFPLCGANFTTEMIVPSVNPVLTVEAPYDTENTWTLTFDEDVSRDYTWRDKGDTNAGHIAIVSHEDIRADIWWSAGDDFEVANFYGVPKTKWNGWAYRWNDRQGPSTGFRTIEGSTTVDSLAVTQMERVVELGKKAINSKTIMRAAIGSIPYVGTPMVVADLATNVENKLELVVNDAGRTMSVIEGTAQNIGIATEQLSTLLRESIDKVSNMFSKLVNGATILYDVLLDVVMAWMEKSWKIVAIGIIRFISKILVIDTSLVSSIMEYATSMAQCIGSIFCNNTPRVQAETDYISTYTGILAGILGTIMGVSVANQRWRSAESSFGELLLDRLTHTTGITYLNQVLLFIQKTFESIKSIIMSLLGYVSPEAEALRMLSGNNEMIAKFVREAQIITSETNTGMLALPAYRRRFWFTVLQAHQIQRTMCRVPTNCVSYQLSKLCGDVIKAGNEKFLDLNASPVRFEPIVICLEGPPGVGKSHVTETLVDKLLTAINYDGRVSEKIFYRTAGERFWSGYRDQPVVVYDEWLNTTDPTRCYDQIAEMMKLKSTALFIPEMAHLEEKKVRGNPLIIIVCCNDAFPNNLSNYATSPAATLRRRDFVFKVTRKERFRGVDLKSLEGDLKEQVKRYEHLNFQKYNDVANVKSINNIYKDFETMSQWLVQRWLKYYEAEMGQVEIRMKRLPQYIESIDGGLKMQDPFTLFYQLGVKVDQDISTSLNGYTHYEALETAMSLVEHALNGPVQENKIPTPELVPWELAQNTANTQSLLTDMTLGVLLYGWIPNIIANATIPQLIHWEDQMNPIRTRLGECVVCMEETSCAYVCTSTYASEEEIKHLVCLPCMNAWKTHSTGNCPKCRDPHMIPLIGREETSQLSVWTRLALTGVKSFKWLMERLKDYYNWREQHYGWALLTEYLMELAYMFTTMYVAGSNQATQSVGNVINIIAAQRYAWIGSFFWNNWNEISNIWGAHVQSDEWGEGPEYIIPRVESDPEDVFEVHVNNAIITRFVEERHDHALCLHGKLRQCILSAQWVRNKWRVPDSATAQMIEVDPHLCKYGCLMDFGENEAINTYKTLVERYLNLHKRTLRSAIITYYNNPTEMHLNLIPILFRPGWIEKPQPILTNDWWEYLSEQWHNYRDIIIYCGAAIGVIAAMCGAYRLALSLGGSTTIISQASATAGSPEPSARAPRRVINRQGRTRSAYFHSEDSTPSVYEVTVQYVIRNTFQLEIIRGTQKIRTMFGTGLFNHYLLVPRHYVKEIRKLVGAEGCKLYGFPVTNPALRSEIVPDMSKMIESDDTDLAYFAIPPKFPLFKDIRKFLALESDFDKPITSEGILLVNPKGTRAGELMREHVVDIDGILDRLPVIDQTDDRFEVCDVIRYNYSKPGVCGSLLLRENHQRPILSMHFAGDPSPTGYGYGIPLTQESLSVLCEMKGVPVQFDDQPYASIENAKFVFEDNIHLAYYGSVTPDKVPYIPNKSKLEPSLIHNKEDLSTVMEPAILDKRDPRYIHQETPLFAGVKKHGKITQDFPQEYVEWAGETYWDLWLSSMKPLVANPQVLTDDQCVVGIPGIAHYVPMDLTTSAGYPFNLDKQRTLKQHYITVERNEQLQPIAVESWDPQLTKILKQKRALRKRGIVPHTLFIDTLKDEKRKREKLMKVGGTRVFCSSPMDYVIECRKYFMHFVAAFMDKRHDLMHAVGINPTSDEWTTLMEKLVRKNVKFGTIDYSNFGPGYNASVARKAYELIVRWTMEHVKDQNSELNEQELWCIVYECLQSIHICSNTVYQQGAGSPSGAFFTTIINTLVNILYLLIAWRILVEDEVPRDLLLGPEFKRNVALYCYGDDGIFAVSDQYKDIYNMKTITELFAKYDIVATDATKSDVIKEWEEISTAQFLKRGFLRHPYKRDRWLAPLNWESVVSCTQWIWKSENRKEATLVNAKAALMEAYGHGPEKFGEFKVQVNRALRKVRIPAVSGTWEEYDRIFLDKGFEFDMDQFIIKNLY